MVHMVTALYPGSFDPVTNGHLDMIQRAANIFDQVVVAVGYNPKKRAWLDVATRVRLLQNAIAALHNINNVTVTQFSGLVADAANAEGAQVILKGIRGATDAESEAVQANVNKKLSGIETLWLPASNVWRDVSSSVVRELVTFDASIENYVPEGVEAAMQMAVQSRTLGTGGV